MWGMTIMDHMMAYRSLDLTQGRNTEVIPLLSVGSNTHLTIGENQVPGLALARPPFRNYIARQTMSDDTFHV